jgi:pyruvate dehydrogenase E1 component beta subunit
MIRAAASSREPVVILEPKALYRQVGLAPEASEGEGEDVLGTARRVREGGDLVLFAWGAAVPVAVEAAERMTADGYEVGVVDLRVLAPLDVATIGESVQATGRALVVHDCGGAFAGEVARVATEASFLWLESPIGLVSHLQHAPGEAPSRADREAWVGRVREAALATLGY